MGAPILDLWPLPQKDENLQTAKAGDHGPWPFNDWGALPRLASTRGSDSLLLSRSRTTPPSNLGAQALEVDD